MKLVLLLLAIAVPALWTGCAYPVRNVIMTRTGEVGTVTESKTVIY